jgi:MYXO-CTERM domain-containing protein
LRILPIATSLLLTVPSLASAEVVWRADFETGNISQFDGRPQMVSPDRLMVVSSPVAEGRYALQATVVQYDNPIDASGNRNELVHFGNETEGKEYYYRWYTMFAEDFPAPDTWQLFVQWHQSGDSGSPPVEFVVRNDSIRLGVGGTGTSIWTTPLVRGVWQEFIFHVRWSSNPSVGFVELYLNGELAIPKRSIATLFPGQSNYMKAGLYRNNIIEPVGRVWHDGFIQATTLEEVIPPKPQPQPTPDAGTPPGGTPPGTDAGTPPGEDGGVPGQPTQPEPPVTGPDAGTTLPGGGEQPPATPLSPSPLPGDPLETAGCSAASSAPWLLGLVSLLGLALRRRRSTRG